jgi:hypothetical protein
MGSSQCLSRREAGARCIPVSFKQALLEIIQKINGLQDDDVCVLAEVAGFAVC